MKTILLTFILAFIAHTSITAQEVSFSKEMESFYEYCIEVRNGVQQKDISRLEKCIIDWDGENILKYKNIEMELSTLDDIVSVDTIGKTEIGGHLQFSPAFVDSLVAYGSKLDNFPNIEQCMKDFTDETDLVRGGTYDCAFTHIAIKPGKEVILSLAACGECELFVISENGTKIASSIILEDSKKPILKNTSDASRYKWEMKNGRYSLSIKNPSKQNVSVIIASN